MYALTDEEKPLRRDSALRYIQHHRTDVLDFLRSRVKDWDRVKAVSELSEGDINPVIFAYILKNSYIMSEWERWDKVMGLVTTPGNLTVMIGAKRHGKTAVTFKIIEDVLARGITPFWYGFSPVVKKYYPEVQQILEIEKAEKGVIITDEAAIVDPAGKHQTNTQSERMSLIWTTGHRDCALIYISQTFGVDIRILRAMDLIWFKPFFDMDFDRVQASRFFNDAFEYIRPITKTENLIINYQQGHEAWMIDNTVPQRWNDELSKPFSLLKSREEALEYITLMENAGIMRGNKATERDFYSMLLQRGWNRARLDQLIGKRERIVPPGRSR
jgi:hypothetical protein